MKLGSSERSGKLRPAAAPRLSVPVTRIGRASGGRARQSMWIVAAIAARADVVPCALVGGRGGAQSTQQHARAHDAMLKSIRYDRGTGTKFSTSTHRY
eukprot:SAG31_NODE_1874_length_7020_cov_57.579541_3_plen_98_part_00